MTSRPADNGHTDSGNSGASTQTPTGPNSGFPTAKPGQVSGGTDGKGGN